MCNTLPVHILGYCFGKGVCVDTLAMNQSDCLANYLDVAGEGWYHVGHHIIRRAYKMNVKFSFDRVAVERRGFTLEDVYRTIKDLFTTHDFPCVSDGDALAFKDKGDGDDFAVMWDIVLSLLRSDWFVECATSCVWLDEDGEEDILAQVGKA